MKKSKPCVDTASSVSTWQKNFTTMQPERPWYWHDYLCEYYNVTPSQALKLGSRSEERKPDLPGSRTCEPVYEQTFEDIWNSSERKTDEQVFQFYRDQGSWSSFRQSVRHKDMIQTHQFFTDLLIKFFGKRSSPPGYNICEYGCGIAPFLTTFLLEIWPEVHANLSLTDIEGCEHLAFAEWKLNKIVKKRNLENVNIACKPVTASGLPKYDEKLDAVILFEVLEHVPSPVETITNLTKQMKSGAILVENFIKHEEFELDLERGGPDLLSATGEREEYYKFLDFYFINHSVSPDLEPDATRCWQKK